MISLKLSLPASIVEYGRDFIVAGQICADEPLPENTVFKVELFKDKQLLRYVRQDHKNDRRLYLEHPDLVSYKEELDPHKEKLQAFGFPELQVRDRQDPLASFHNATIKAYYDDQQFKAVIVSGSDVAHGRILDGGVDFTDENGEPYTVLPEGEYELKVSLTYQDQQLAVLKDKVVISHNSDQAIVRFNPPAHKERIVKWCAENNYSVIKDPLPGYLDPYLGEWYYHMGLLKYYRSNDVVLYLHSRVHMFVYLIAADSTSYATEYAYLQSRGLVGDQERFTAYHYDIGEALFGTGKSYARGAQICTFSNDLDLYRLDIVNEKAKENFFDLNEEDIIDTFYVPEKVDLKAPCRVAISGVIRPSQFDPADFVLLDDNTYDTGNVYEKLLYIMESDSKKKEEIRDVGLCRYDSKDIGSSVFEFRNVFEFTQEYAGKTVQITMVLIDRKGQKKAAGGAGLQLRFVD